jgi:hypothetical protein
LQSRGPSASEWTMVVVSTVRRNIVIEERQRRKQSRVSCLA